MARAILFDLVGVLLIPDPACRPVYILKSFDEMIGQCIDDAQLRTLAMEQFHWTEMDFRRHLTQVAHQYIRYQPLWDHLPRLKNRFRLGIINNGTFLTFPTFQIQHPLDEIFEVIICSGREGIRKPDKRIYSLAADRLGIPAGECLFMDDSLENVTRAEATGMTTIHWPDIHAGFSKFQAWLESEAG